MELYKTKYVGLSHLTEQLSDTMSAYVVMCAQFEAMYIRMKEGGGESRKSRSSVMDQLNALEGGGSSVTTTKRTEYVEEYV